MVLLLVPCIPGYFETSSTGNASLGGGDVAPIDLLRFLWPKLFARPVDSLLSFTLNELVCIQLISFPFVQGTSTAPLIICLEVDVSCVLVWDHVH